MDRSALRAALLLTWIAAACGGRSTYREGDDGAGEGGTGGSGVGGSSGGRGGTVDTGGTGGSTGGVGGTGGSTPDPCDPNPCAHNGRCVDGFCSCTGTGYDGPTCSDDVDECTLGNGGCDPLTECTNVPGSRVCGPCPPGFDGSGETGCRMSMSDPCDPNPCENGGACTGRPGTFVCSCVPPWTGSTCESTVATITVAAASRGWWNQSGQHTNGLLNTLTGYCGSCGIAVIYNSFFVFDVPVWMGTLTSVSVRLEHENYTSPDPVESFSVWDVSTPIGTLLASSTGNFSAYEDLMSGVQYGKFIASSQSVGTLLEFDLGPEATKAVTAAQGGQFAIGLHEDSYDGTHTGIDADEWARFSSDSEPRQHELVLTIAP